jgi:hypothetical protein
MLLERQNRSRFAWLMVCVLLTLLGSTACSAQRQVRDDHVVTESEDLFTDPFFTEPIEPAISFFEQDEASVHPSEERPEPQSILQRSQDVLLSVFMLAGSMGQFALMFLGI